MSAVAPLARLKEALRPSEDVRSAFLVTYGLDPRFFEAEVLPALLPTKLANDATAGSLSAYLHEADQAAATAPIEVLYDHLTGEGPQLFNRYRQVVLGNRAFHPKLILAEYDDALRAVVASANLTRPGWTSLFELFVVDELQRGAQHSWASGLRSFLAAASDAAGGRGAAAERMLAFLDDVDEAPHPTLHHSFDSALVEAAFPTASAAAIDITSPFFEGEDGEGLFDELRRRHPDADLTLYLAASQQAESGYIVHGPPEKLEKLRADGARLRLLHSHWEGDDDTAPDHRGLHGKMLAFRVGRRWHVVIGSANATRAALLKPVASSGNAELVVTLELDQRAYERLLPPAFEPDRALTFDPGDPSGEEEGPQHDTSRFVSSATYSAAGGRLRLELVDGAPPLVVHYAGRALGMARPPDFECQLPELTADAFVTVDGGNGPAVVPFVVVDPEALAPRGTPLDLDLEALADLLAGRRELVHQSGSGLRASTGSASAASGSPVFGRGAIPWRRILAGLRGLHDDLVRQLAIPEAVTWTLRNPVRLAGLRERFEEARRTDRFLDGDLAFALHESSAMLRQVRAAAVDFPISARLVAEVEQELARDLEAALENADPTVRAQLEVLAG